MALGDPGALLRAKRELAGRRAKITVTRASALGETGFEPAPARPSRSDPGVLARGAICGIDARAQETPARRPCERDLERSRHCREQADAIASGDVNETPASDDQQSCDPALTLLLLPPPPARGAYGARASSPESCNPMGARTPRPTTGGVAAARAATGGVSDSERLVAPAHAALATASTELAGAPGDSHRCSGRRRQPASSDLLPR
jgi:hypothetical protein